MLNKTIIFYAYSDIFPSARSFATKAIKNVNFVVYSSPELANGENYTITATSEAVVTPTNVPTEEPTVEPTAEPTVEPTAKPTTKPTTAPVTMEKINVKATLKTAKSQKNKVTLKWKKANGVSGYEIYQAIGKNGTYKKVATVKKASKITYVDKKLKTGKKYYYKIRTYKTVNGKKVYGEYSAVKTVKIK